jgi:hypothetical protein
MRVFVVWEPILTGDWRRPTTRTLKRITDSRAAQFWDPEHLIAEELRGAAERNARLPRPSCCINHGHFWDMVAVFPQGARANDVLPAPDFFDGTVVDRETAIREKVREMLSPQTSLAPF